MRSLYLLIASALCAYPSFASPGPQQAPITGAIPFTFRNATLDDIDDITTVHMEAFKPGPTWGYIRQFADVYPNYTWTCQRELFKQIYLNTTGLKSVVIKVISVPDPTSHRKERVVSLSAWQLSLLNHSNDEAFSLASSAGLQAEWLSSRVHSTAQSNLGFDCEAHLDMNRTRAEAFGKALLAAEDKYLTKPYGPQLVLGLLATHPEWDGNGFASRHLRWGKETLAELNRGSKRPEHRLPITLIGTPAGYPLYISEGFEGVKNITIERLDGKGILWYEAMKYDEGDD